MSRGKVVADCLECKWREKLNHSSHSKCCHPEFTEMNESKIGEILTKLGKRAGSIHLRPKTIEVIGDPHGMDSGWFNHPFNYDPIWLLKCTGYKHIDADTFKDLNIK